MSLSINQWKLYTDIMNGSKQQNNKWFVGALVYKKINEKINEDIKVVEYKCLDHHFELHYQLIKPTWTTSIGEIRPCNTERMREVLINVKKIS